MRFLNASGLPRTDVCVCAVGNQVPAVPAALERRGIHCVIVSAHPALAPPVASHADLQLCVYGAGHALIAPDSGNLAQQLHDFGIQTEYCSPLGETYPNDVRLCAAIVGKTVIANYHTIDKKLTNIFDSQQRHRCQTAQGYTRCSVCMVDDNTILTSDSGIAKAAKDTGMDVFQIVPGHIQLNGYDTGFIGGCSGFIGPRTLAFTGTLSSHPDGQQIKAFLQGHGITYVELLKGPLIDVGSILPLMEVDRE